MSKYDFDRNLLERVTDLLMDNGCTINAKAMRELTRFIAIRDGEIISRVISDAEKTLANLQIDSRVEDKTDE